MKTIAITGSKGKTTTTWMIRHLLRSAGRRVGLLGTFEYDLSDGRMMYANNTTPSPKRFDQVLAMQEAAGAEFSVFEIASGTLSDNRMGDRTWDLGAITCIRRGYHVDGYPGVDNSEGCHPDYENYIRCKQSLADRITGTLFLNADDPLVMAASARARGRVETYGVEARAPYQAEVLGATLRGTDILLKTPAGPAIPTLHLLGRHQAYNAALACAIAVRCGLSLPEIVAGLESMPPVRCRLETLGWGDGFPVILDGCHPVDAMRSTLETLREVLDPGGRIIVVFGESGGRPDERRRAFGDVLDAGADSVVLTSDNPGGECPSAIATQVACGRPMKFAFVKDRTRAIETAIRAAAPGDVVLVCGRVTDAGYLRFDVGVDESVVFSDHVAVRAALRTVYGFAAVEPAETPCPHPS